ncbi:MAG: TraR/DksA family transcriptional regulator [Planctomycetales bacterium]|nr:TraR/DksA family transcriptional regulator [Planctomycetales bacterium]
MKKSEAQKFKKVLIDRRKLILGDIGNMEAETLRKNRQDATGDLSTMPLHMADVSGDNYEQELTLGLIEAEQAEVRDIDAALKRIEDGTFGECENCNDPIKPARLKAIPHARLCVDCKRKEEEGEI